MVPYNTPQTIRPLEKMVCDFAYSNGYDPISVFNDFLRYVIHGFSPGAPPLMDWKYKRQQNRHFMEMLTGWIRSINRYRCRNRNWRTIAGCNNRLRHSMQRCRRLQCITSTRITRMTGSCSGRTLMRNIRTFRRNAA